MKKLSTKRKLWNECAAHRRLKDRFAKKKYSSDTNRLQQERVQREIKKRSDRQFHAKKAYHIVAPQDFSLSNNYNETITFIYQFNKYLKDVNNCREIIADMTNVQLLSYDSLMCMIAILSEAKAREIPFSIKIKKPTNQNSLEYMINYFNSTGMFKSTEIRDTESTNVFSMMIQIGGNPDSAESLKNFIDEKLGFTEASSIPTRKIYGIIIDLMINSSQHAYTENAINRLWYILCTYDRNSNKISFTILDRGKSIPHTVNKKFAEKIVRNDSMLILSALNGEDRSSTKLKYRGGGLCRLKKLFDKKIIFNLVVLSRYGSYASNSILMDRKIEGTVISFDITKESLCNTL